MLSIFPDVTNSVSMREEFNKDFVTIVPKPSWRGIEKNLKFMTKAGHGVQSEGERIIADRLYECEIDYIYDSLIEVNGEWIRPDFILPGLNNLILEYKGMDRILKTHFDSFRDKGLLPPELEKLNGYVKLFDNIELLKAWRNNLKGVQWIDENGNIFRGAVDNILQKEDKLIVLDYKTRGYPLKDDTAEHYQDQLDIYNLLLRKNGYKTEDYAYLLFYHPNKINENGDVIFHTDLIKIEISIKNAESIFKVALNVLQGEIPDTSKECEFCKWVDLCR